jgi:hypothetical protein
LTADAEMGQLFKALAVFPTNAAQPAGFPHTPEHPDA